MANHLAGEVEIQVGEGKPMIFRLGINEMLELQAALGLTENDNAFLAVFNEDRLRNLANMRAIAYHGLKRDQPNITPEAAGDVIVAVGLERFGEVIKAGLRWAVPEKDAESGGDGDPSRPSRGPTSSRTRPGRR